jgi:hypothetical protein
MLRRALLTASLLAATATTASAGSYLSLGLGGDPAIQGDLRGAAGGEGEGGNGRLALGQRFGRLALEGSLSRYGISDTEATAAGVHLRLTVPIDGGFGAYLRGGLEYVWLGDAGPSGDTSGDGVVGGVGLEYRLEAPVLGEASIWGEVSEDRWTTDVGEGGARLWTLGFSIGI